jgi:hypothetical protein
MTTKRKGRKEHEGGKVSTVLQFESKYSIAITLAC